MSLTVRLERKKNKSQPHLRVTADLAAAAAAAGAVPGVCRRRSRRRCGLPACAATSCGALGTSSSKLHSGLHRRLAPACCAEPLQGQALGVVWALTGGGPVATGDVTMPSAASDVCCIDTFCTGCWAIGLVLSMGGCIGIVTLSGAVVADAAGGCSGGSGAAPASGSHGSSYEPVKSHTSARASTPAA